MRDIYAGLNTLRDRYSGSRIFLLLDYDGTLTPIAESPQKALLPVKTKLLLKKLSRSADCKVAVISGRSLKDIKSMAGLKDIIYAGNHGLELECPKIRFHAPLPYMYKGILKKLMLELRDKLSGIKGVLLEDKELSIALHYRKAVKSAIPLIKEIFTETVKPFITRKKIKISSGKMVLEVSPPVMWDKGRIALWILSKYNGLSKKDKYVPVYIGDDITDEDAFLALKGKGLTVCAGAKKRTYAEYQLKDTKEVIKFLKAVLNRNKSLCRN